MGGVDPILRPYRYLGPEQAAAEEALADAYKDGFTAGADITKSAFGNKCPFSVDTSGDDK